MICQSCAMPIQHNNQRGTEKNGDYSFRYCNNCFKDGNFTDKETTLEKMAGIYVEKAVELGESEGVAKERANNIFPTLDRYR